MRRLLLPVLAAVALFAPVAQAHVPEELAVVAALDTVRRDRGLPPLRPDERLGAAARAHAADMVRTQAFSHVGADGMLLVVRVRASGYLRGARAWWLGEALQWHTGARSGTEVVDAWLASPPHRRLLLRPRARDVGVGMAPGIPRPGAGADTGVTWVLELGAVRTTPR